MQMVIIFLTMWIKLEIILTTFDLWCRMLIAGIF